MAHTGLASSNNPINEYYDPEKNIAGDNYLFCETTPTYIRHEFIRKVIAIITLQLAATAGFIVTVHNVESMKDAFLEHPGFVAIPMIIFLAISVSAIFVPNLFRSMVSSIICASIMTICMAVSTAFITVRHNFNEILLALGITVAVLLAIIAFSLQTKYDFTGWHIYFVVASIILVFGGVSMIFIRNKVVQILWSLLSCILISGFIVMDIQMVVGGRKHERTVDDYILAAICIYCDIISLFLHILSIIRSIDS